MDRNDLELKIVYKPGDTEYYEAKQVNNFLDEVESDVKEAKQLLEDIRSIRALSDIQDCFEKLIDISNKLY